MYMWLFQGFKTPEKPFLRMNYSDAITYLREHEISKEDGSFYEFGEVSNK
jgi:asparaginyl-tRNA synthetase